MVLAEFMAQAQVVRQRTDFLFQIGYVALRAEGRCRQNHVKHADRRRRPGENEAAAAAASGNDQPMPAQAAKDLDQIAKGQARTTRNSPGRHRRVRL